MAIPDQPPTPPPPGTAARTVHILGEVLVTAGIVVLMFVVYELYVTNSFTARARPGAA